MTSYADTHRISRAEHDIMLAGLGWTPAEWDRGCKASEPCGSKPVRASPTPPTLPPAVLALLPDADGSGNAPQQGAVSEHQLREALTRRGSFSDFDDSPSRQAERGEAE